MSDEQNPAQHAWVPGTSQRGYGTGKVGIAWLMAVPASSRVAWTDTKLRHGAAVWPLPPGVENLYPRGKGRSGHGAATVVLWPTLRLLSSAAREPAAPTCVVAGPLATEEDAARGWAIAVGAVNLDTGQVEPDPVTAETREAIAGIVQVGYNGYSRSSHGGKAALRQRDLLRADPGFTPGLVVGATIAAGNGTGGCEDLLKILGA